MPVPQRSLKPLIVALAGFLIGAILIALVLWHFDFAEAKRIMLGMSAGWVAASVGVYWLALTIRVLRWHLLLAQLCPGVGRAKIAETLVIGYAVNTVLPARLGELFRADYAGKRFAVPRSAAFGSILVERTMDGLAVVGFLAMGLLALPTTGSSEAVKALQAVAVAGACLFLGVVAAIVAVRQLGRRDWRLPARLAGMLAKFTDGVRTLNRVTLAEGCGLTVAVWLLETTAFWCMVRATGPALGPAEALVLIGAASLSTLVPTAPGFLGSFQFVFALCFTAFGLSDTIGIVAASAVQIFILGSVVVAGLTLLMGRSLHATLRASVPAWARGPARNR